MKEKFNNLAYVIASLGLVGVVPAARVWGSLLGFVLLWLLSFLKGTFPFAAPISFCLILALLFLVAWYVRRDVPEEREADIVIDRLAGVAVALAWLSELTPKFALFGFSLFHLWLFISVLAQRVYVYDNKTATGAVTLSSGEILLIALLTNGLLRVLWWITH